MRRTTRNNNEPHYQSWVFGFFFFFLVTRGGGLPALFHKISPGKKEGKKKNSFSFEHQFPNIMSMRTGATLRFEPGSIAEILYDCYIGIVVGARHYLWFLSKWTSDFLFDPLMNLTGLSSKQALSEATPKGQLRVVGIGFGRTGTVSLLCLPFRHGPVGFAGNATHS